MFIDFLTGYIGPLNCVYYIRRRKGIYGWGTTFKTKDLRTLSHWISAFIMIPIILINQFK